MSADLPSRLEIRSAVVQRLHRIQPPHVQPMPVELIVRDALREMNITATDEIVRLCILHVTEADDLTEIVTQLRTVRHNGAIYVYLQEWLPNGQRSLLGDDSESAPHFFRAHCIERGIAIPEV